MQALLGNIDYMSSEAVNAAYRSGRKCGEQGYALSSNPFMYSVGKLAEIAPGMVKHFEAWNKGWSDGQAS